MFLLVKFVHLSAVILMVGATVINGLLHAQAKGASPLAATALLTAVMGINRKLMAPALLVIPVSGVMLMHLAGYSLSSMWLSLSFAITVGLLLAFAVGYRLERQLEMLANRAQGTALPQAYHRIFAKTVPVGGGALVLSIAALALMIFKPV